MATKYYWYAGVALLVAAVFFARWEILVHTEARNSLIEYADRAAVVSGRVAADPDRRATSLRATIKVKMINGQEAPHGTIVAILPRETELGYGDTVEVRGLLSAPQAFETEQGRVFDYPGYLRVRGVSMVLERATLREREVAGVTVFGSLYWLKHMFERSLELNVAEPEVSLLEGMLLGERGGFDQALLDIFVIVGLIHIVVLSGSNIAIVAEGVFRLLGACKLPRNTIYIVGFGTIVLFALMTGGGAATVRAVIMGSIAILARYLHRPEAALRALLVAAALMVLWNPLVLWLDTGFILSFVATFGLITLSPYIESKLVVLPVWERFNIRSIVASTLAVELFLLPALLYTSGVLSLVSLPANILVLPLVPVAMLLGFVTGVLGIIHPLLAFVPAFFTQLVVRLILGVAELFAALPFAHAVVVPFPAWVVLLVYIPLTWAALKIFARQQTN